MQPQWESLLRETPLLSRANCRWITLGISIRSPFSVLGHSLGVGCARSGHYFHDPVCAAAIARRKRKIWLYATDSLGCWMQFKTVQSLLVSARDP
jgi:hypothetical protein